MMKNKNALLKLKNEPHLTGIATDFDGTVSEIMPVQAQATINKKSKALLAKLENNYRIVAVVSGREVKQLAGLVGLNGLYYVGNHGAEYLSNGYYCIAGEALKYKPEIENIHKTALNHFNSNSYYIDYKKFSLAVHYRRHPNPKQAKEELLETLSPLTKPGLKLSQGRMVYDVSVKSINKGLAVEHIVDEFNLANFIFFGDDKTDVDAFKKMNELKNKGLNVIKVALASNESPPDLLEHADLTVDSVEEVNKLFETLL